MGRNVFLSYQMTRMEPAISIIERLEEEGYNVYWIPPENHPSSDKALKSELIRMMRRCSVVVVLVSPGAYTRDWMSWEVKWAAKLRKRIVGVYEHGKSDAGIPQFVKDNADALVRNNVSTIIQAIEGDDIWDWGEPREAPIPWWVWRRMFRKSRW